MISRPATTIDFANAFTQRNLQEFGFSQSRDIIVEDVRVRSVGKERERGVDEPFSRVGKNTFSPPGCPNPTRI